MAATLLPLDDLWAELNYLKVIPGPLANTFKFNGHYYGVPLNMHIQNIMYYNKKLFAELKLKEPKNFDELMKVAAAIKKAKPKMYPLGLGTKEKWEAAFVLDEIILGEGGPEYYVKLFKGEIDVTKDKIFRTALEKLAKTEAIYLSVPLQSDLGPVGEFGGLRRCRHGDDGNVGHRRIPQQQMDAGQ